MTREQLKERVRKLPMQPGVYMHKDKTGKVIYVGKAKLLKNRVSNYFQPPERLNAKTRQLVSHIDDFDIIVTDSEFEALVLENSMIKKYKPKYNILLKDDKGYPYVRLDTTLSYPDFKIRAPSLHMTERGTLVRTWAAAPRDERLIRLVKHCTSKAVRVPFRGTSARTGRA